MVTLGVTVAICATTVAAVTVITTAGIAAPIAASESVLALA